MNKQIDKYLCKKYKLNRKKKQGKVTGFEHATPTTGYKRSIHYANTISL